MSTLRRAVRGRGGADGGYAQGLVAVMVLHAVLGGVFGMLPFMGIAVFDFCLILSAVTFLFAGMTLVAETSTLLFDPREHDILGHRPIHPRTLLLARALGLASLALMLALAVNLVPLFTGLAARGARPWFPLAHLFSVLLLVPFTAATVVFVYALLARHVSRRRFDAVATWAQVLVTAALIVSYQLVPRLMDGVQGVRIDTGGPLMLFLPPAWFASLTDLLMANGASPRRLAMAAMALICAPLLGWAAVRYFAVGYARQVAALSETSLRRAAAETARPASARRRDGDSRSIEERLGFWLRDPIERTAFRLAAAYFGRDRDMKMRIYPQLAAFGVLVAVTIVDRETSTYLAPFLILLIAGTLPLSILTTLKMTSQYAAADVFRYAPIPGTAPVFHGMRKAVLFFFVLPALVVSATVLWFVLPDHDGMRFALSGLVALPTLSLLSGGWESYLPLSVPPAGLRQSLMTAGLFFLSTAWIGGFVGLGAVADRAGWFWPSLAIEVVALALFHRWLLRIIRRRPLPPQEA